MQDLVGQSLGHYRLLALLGRGGMGVVYRAEDQRLGRLVAVKLLLAEVASDPDRLRRFELEARAAGGVNHPAILTVHEVGTHQGRPSMVTELLGGRSLRQVVAAGGVTLARALDYGRQVAAGLAAAHERGITHRDLKPENLFLTADGRGKILDYRHLRLRRGAVRARDGGAPVPRRHRGRHRRGGAQGGPGAARGAGGRTGRRRAPESDP